MKTAVRKIFGGLISVEIQSQYSGCGRKQKITKKNFSQTEVFKLVASK